MLKEMMTGDVRHHVLDGIERRLLGVSFVSLDHQKED
jgi:hypothetical protein